MAGTNNNRINFLLALFFLFSIIVAGRMFYWQIVKHSVYIALAEGQRVFLSKLFPARGGIFINDKSAGPLLGQAGGSSEADGQIPYFPVAINKPGYSVYAVPAQIKDIKKTAEPLAEILNMPREIVTQRLDKPNDYYEIIARRVSEDDVSKIKSLNLKGIRFEPETWRYWPEKNLMAQVLGFVGFSGNKRQGQYGIEGYFNKELEGKSGIIEAEQDSGGSLISLGIKKYAPAENGLNLVLTIDRAIQYKVEQEISRKAEELKAKSAEVIVIEPQTGKILAMAGWPGFDLNSYSAVDDFNVFLNKNIQARYEPGSVIKPFTLAIALNENKITPDTTYEDKGKLIIDGWPVGNSDDKVYGAQTMTEVLEKSLNTGAIFAASRVDKDVFQNYFKNFGFDAATGIELQGEVSGDLSNLDSKRDIAFANASFGQGIAVTPIELAAAFSSLVNGGKLMKPYIIDRIIKEDGKVARFNPEETKKIISSETSAKITAMLVKVVENGHAKKAAIKGYWIGGKTGTAQVPFADKRGYSEKTIHTFVGFGPAPDPKFLVLVKIDEPKEAKFAETSAAPVFNNIAKFLFNYLGIPPNRK